MELGRLIAVKNIFAQHAQEKITATVSYKIYKLCKSIEPEETFYHQRRKQLIEQFAQRDDEGNIINNNGSILLQPDKIEQAQQLLNELTSVDVDCPNIKFKLSELSEIKLSVSDIATIESLIEE